MPNRRALQIEASPELQQLKDSLDDTNLFLRRQTKQQEVQAKIREAADAHGVAAADIAAAATPPAPPPPRAVEALGHATAAAMRAQQQQLESYVPAIAQAQAAADRSASMAGQIGGPCWARSGAA